MRNCISKSLINKILAFTLYSLIFFLLSCTSTGRNKNKSNEELLLGTWTILTNSADGVSLRGETTYFVSGQVKWTGTFSDKSRRVGVEASGTWKIKGGYLYTQVVDSNAPEIFPVGLTASDRIVEITKYRFVYIDEDGNKNTEYRKTRF